MGEIIGGGLNEMPWLRYADEHMATMLENRLRSPDLDSKWKDPNHWPEPMREEYGDDKGLTAARELSHDRFDGGRPNEGLRILIPGLQGLLIIKADESCDPSRATGVPG